MTADRIARLRNLVFQVQQNAWKRRTGTRSERQGANESDIGIIDPLCGALEEALGELEKNNRDRR